MRKGERGGTRHGLNPLAGGEMWQEGGKGDKEQCFLWKLVIEGDEMD